MILPQRHPAYLAKEVATLDQLSGGRTILGVGIGWLREEFEALGIPFEERAARTEEICAALRTLWSRGARSPSRASSTAGRPCTRTRSRCSRAVRRSSSADTRRARRGAPPASATAGSRCATTRCAFAGLVAELRGECARIGRDPARIEITTGFPKTDLDAVRKAEELGVGRLVIGPPAFDPEGLRRGLETVRERGDREGVSMRVRVLGSAAGGGLPQWNCGCPNCARARAGDPAVPPRAPALASPSPPTARAGRS